MSGHILLVILSPEWSHGSPPPAGVNVPTTQCLTYARDLSRHLPKGTRIHMWDERITERWMVTCTQ